MLYPSSNLLIVKSMENHKLHISFLISHFSLAVSVVISMLWKWVRVDGLQSFYKKRRAFTPFKFITVKFVDNVEFCCCLCNKTRANCLHFLFSSLYFENVKFSECSCGGVWVCVLMNIHIHVCTYLLYVGVLMTICMSTYVLWSASELLLYLLYVSHSHSHRLHISKRPLLITSTVLHEHLSKHLYRILTLLNFWNMLRKSLSQIWKHMCNVKINTKELFA